jgi:ABC-2 type transport system permease protein
MPYRTLRSESRSSTLRVLPSYKVPEFGSRYTTFRSMSRQAVVLLLIVLAFGILVPWYKGFAFLDPRMIVAYACLALLFVAPASAEAFATGSAGSALNKIFKVVAYGWGMTVLILVTGFITINLTQWQGEILRPPMEVFAAALLFSLTASIAIAAFSALLARHLSAGAVKMVLRLCFLLVLLIFVSSSRMPDRWQIFLDDHTTRRAITQLAWQGAAMFAVIGGVLMILVLRKPRNENEGEHI